MSFMILMTFLNILTSSAFRLAEQKTRFGKLNPLLREAIIGLVFGFISLVGNELALIFGKANIIANVSSAGPLCAGLLFGGRAGILAGLIAGMQLWVSGVWGAGLYTRAACTGSAILTGLVAAFMRRYFFKGRYPTVLYGLTLAAGMEVIHMLLVLLTHIDDLFNAFQVVHFNGILMILSTSFSVTLSIIAFQWIDFRNPGGRWGEETENCPVASRRMVVLLSIGASVTLLGMTGGMFFLQTHLSESYVYEALASSLDEVRNDYFSGNPMDNDVNHLLYAIHEHHIHFFNDGNLLVADHQFRLYDNEKDVWTDTYFPLELRPVQNGRLYQGVYNDQKIYYAYLPIREYYLIAVVPKAVAMFSRNVSIYLMTFMAIILFSILFFGSYYLIRKSITRNIQDVNRILTKITGEDFDLEVNSEGNDRFIPIIEELNHVVVSLERHSKGASAQFTVEQANTKKFQHAAEHDALTGLLNRSGFERMLAQRQGYEEPVGFMYIDVDHFKDVNDQYGHDVGDRILQRVASALRSNFRTSDLLVRLGGDEFAALLVGCSIQEREMIQRKVNLINRTLEHMEGMPPVSLSIGVAFDDMCYSEALCSRADAALYMAKEGGRQQCVFAMPEKLEEEGVGQ